MCISALVNILAKVSKLGAQQNPAIFVGFPLAIGILSNVGRHSQLRMTGLIGNHREMLACLIIAIDAINAGAELEVSACPSRG